MVKCQLHDLPEAGRNLTTGERALLRLRQFIHYPSHILRKTVLFPSFVWRRVRDRVTRTFKLKRTPQRREAPGGVLDLQPGERVRVKPLQQILATLDENDRFEGMGFMIDEMGPYCGGTFTVRKRVERFFDERNQQLLKPRHVVILDDVFCEPHPASKSAYAGCARSCFLFWKEAWLERVDTKE